MLLKSITNQFIASPIIIIRSALGGCVRRIHLVLQLLHLLLVQPAGGAAVRRVIRGRHPSPSSSSRDPEGRGGAQHRLLIRRPLKASPIQVGLLLHRHQGHRAVHPLLSCHHHRRGGMLEQGRGLVVVGGLLVRLLYDYGRGKLGRLQLARLDGAGTVTRDL
jgi:hypothetical protein